MQKFVALIPFALMAAATAEPLVIDGRVLGEAGRLPENVSVQLAGRDVAVSDNGEFRFSMEMESAAPVELRVSGDGHYPALQTLHRSDFIPGGKTTLPTIELVQKQAGRRLLLFAGDAMLSRRYFEPRAGEPALARQQSVAEDSRRLLQHVKPYIELADYASVNLETQLASEVLTDRLPKSVTFYSPPELAAALRWAGFDYVALGNNHMFDYQTEGLTSTLAALRRYRFDYSGGGFNDREARQPAVVEINGASHSFLSYVGWPGTFSPSQVAEEGKGGAALGNSDVIGKDLQRVASDVPTVLQLHAGLEYAARPAMSEQTTLRKAVIDGADVVIGHHAHVLQGFEIYRDRLIAYSMGNFLFDQYHYTTQLGMLLYVWLDGDRLHRAEVVPLHINGYVPTPATGSFRYSVLHRLAKLSDPNSVCLRANGLHAVVLACKPEAVTLEVDAALQSRQPLALRKAGVSPLAPVRLQGAEKAYRFGVDILRRGDFEYAGMFGTHDRTWIESEDSRVVTGEVSHLRMHIDAASSSARSGLKVFERVFTLSNPASVSGRIKVDADVGLRISLQRRRPAQALSEALESGPVSEIAYQEFTPDGWHEFTFDYNQPRVTTASVRLLIEVEDRSGSGATVELDDLSWVEWRTPWVEAREDVAPIFATHLQFQE